MPLLPGSRLGPYEIVAPLGAGGMGEVYRARDPRLDRDVAVKILPLAASQDPDRLHRFQHESRAAGALNHPNILAVHDVGSHDGLPYLVCELLEGETLRDAIRHARLTTSKAVEYAAQVADGLAAAHDKGITHRDIKPENLFLTRDGRIKILDFGLAKLQQPRSTPGSDQSPTVTADTKPGTVLGTVGYMSPEQVRGEPADHRSDVFALGTVLYEMLTEKHPFKRDSEPETLHAIVKEDPPATAEGDRTLRRELRQILRHCLEKRAEDRFQSARDLAFHLRAAAEADAPPRRRYAALTATAAVLAGLGLVLAVAVRRWNPGTGPAPPAARPATLTQVTTSAGVEQFPAWSPDGQRLVYSAEAGPVRKLFVRHLDRSEDVQLTQGPEDDIQPAWSPDGRTVLFVRGAVQGRRLEPSDVFGYFGGHPGGDVWAIDVVSGRATLRVRDAYNPAFSPDGARIAVDASWGGPRRLWVLDAQGRNPQQATADVSEALAHMRPRWAPGGGQLVFQNMERTRYDIRVVDLATKKMTSITNDVTPDLDPVWSPGGRSLYFSSGRGGGINLWRVPVSGDGAAGAFEQLTTGAGQDVQLALSPDGKRLAFTILKQNADIWKLPVGPDGRPSGSPQMVVGSTREESRGAWSRDGRQIAFNSDRTGDMTIWTTPAEGGSARQITRGAGGDFQPDWSPDGRHIAFFSSRAGNVDVWTVEVDSGRLRRLTHGDATDSDPVFSPDGGRIAYRSDQGGRPEVWVMNADGSEQRALTQVGAAGHYLRWRPDGGAVLFPCPCGGKPQILQVPVEGGDPEPFGIPIGSWLNERGDAAQPPSVPLVRGGGHMSFSPDFSAMMDTIAHKSLWVSPLKGGAPYSVFQFDDPEVRIDYPVWSPDGRFILMDRFRPQGGDVWLMEGVE